MSNCSAVPYRKPPLSVSDQIKKLQSRGLIINDLNKVEELLSHINYYRLEAYWYTFYDYSQKGDHVFRPRTTFDLIWKHYCFDRRLRAHISHALERIEISFRTQFTYYLSQYYGPFPMEQDNFQFTANEWRIEIAGLQDICRRSSEQFVKHFFRKYTGNVLPIWALVELQSFGAIVRYYSKITSIHIKNQMSSVYKLTPKELRSWLDHLCYVRNICAHHARLWNKRLVKLPSIPQRIISIKLNQSWVQPQPPGAADNHYNERRLFNTILIIDYFLSMICPQNNWRKELVQLIKDYSIDARRMGFPADWESDPHWTMHPDAIS